MTSLRWFLVGVLSFAVSACELGGDDDVVCCPIFEGYEPEDYPGFISLREGTFMMGSPDNELGRDPDERHYSTTLYHDFWMMQFEVLQQSWSRWYTNPSRFVSCGPSCPVDSVTWWEALHFANAYSEMSGLTPCYVMSGCDDTPVGEGRQCSSVALQDADGELIVSPHDCEGYRLPTEVEWEYAYRAGTTTAFYNGEITEVGQDPIDDNLDKIGWFSGNCEVSYEGAFTGSIASENATFESCGTHPAGLKEPNEWGLYDMAGNVSEWIWHLPEVERPLETVDDLTGGLANRRFVLRGGSWSQGASEARASSRQVIMVGAACGDADARPMAYGFRLARTSFWRVLE